MENTLESFYLPNQPHLEIRLLRESDYDKLQIFCNQCKEFGWENNESFSTIKLAQMTMPYGQFFIGYDHVKQQIWTIAGVHHLPEIHDDAWRCLFRGAQLPGYCLSKQLSKDFLKVSVHISIMLYLQIKLILNINKNAKFFISTNNISNSKFFASSQRLDRHFMPSIASRGIVNKEYENFILFNTSQSIWKVDVECYFKEREKSLVAINNNKSWVL